MVKIIHNNGEPVRFNYTPNRNDICPCGSKKKFKKCHIENWQEFLKEHFNKLKNQQQNN